MAHNLLVPENGVYLTNEDIVQLLRGEFLFVEADQELGRHEYDRGLDYLRSLLDKGLRPGGRDIKHELLVAEAKRDTALYVSLADSQEPGDAYLSTTLVTGEPIFFGYYSQSHQDAAMPLLERVRKALGYCEDE